MCNECIAIKDHSSVLFIAYRWLWVMTDVGRGEGTQVALLAENITFSRDFYTPRQELLTYDESHVYSVLFLVVLLRGFLFPL